MIARYAFISAVAAAGIALWCALSLREPPTVTEAGCHPAVLWGCK